MHCVIIALFLESFSVLMEWNRSQERIVLLGWTYSLGASSLFGTFFIFSLDRKFSCCFLGSKLICSAFLVGQSSPSLLPVKTRKFESPMFPTCFLGLQHEITRGRVMPFSQDCKGHKKHAKEVKQKHIEQLAPRTGDC